MEKTGPSLLKDIIFLILGAVIGLIISIMLTSGTTIEDVNLSFDKNNNHTEFKIKADKGTIYYQLKNCDSTDNYYTIKHKEKNNGDYTTIYSNTLAGSKQSGETEDYVIKSYFNNTRWYYIEQSKETLEYNDEEGYIVENAILTFKVK